MSPVRLFFRKSWGGGLLANLFSWYNRIRAVHQSKNAFDGWKGFVCKHDEETTAGTGSESCTGALCQGRGWKAGRMKKVKPLTGISGLNHETVSPNSLFQPQYTAGIRSLQGDSCEYTR